jgi:hypothetical protein
MLRGMSDVPVPDELANEILASDLAAEVKAEFEGRRTVGFTVAAATQHVFTRFRGALSSSQDGPVVLLALAMLQLREGHLQEVIRDAGVDLIESGEAMTAYRTEDIATRKARRLMLEQFSTLLAAASVEPERAD